MIEPVYDRFGITVYHGDNLDVLREMPDASVDSIVTDPPAGITFYGADWDADRGGRGEWVAWLTERMVEAKRVLKPGGHALVWSLPRTTHWTGLALEDAGFEIRDVVQHVTEQGMPKSLDISKEIDRRAPRAGMFEGFAEHYEQQRQAAGLTHSQICEAGHFYATVNHGGASVNWSKGNNVPTRAQWAVLAPLLSLSDGWLPLIDRVEAERTVTGTREMSTRPGFAGATYGAVTKKVVAITEAATDDARRWQGWGTALAPYAEPWWLVRKPLTHKLVSDNVLEHGTGALNIDGARDERGGWPANVARFPKAAPSERPVVAGASHLTIKGVALCRWMVRLVTPPGGIVLDCFAGSGPVGQAARAEGMRAVLIEQDAPSIGFIKARLDARAKTQAGAVADDQPMDLLDLLAGDAS